MQAAAEREAEVHQLQLVLAMEREHHAMAMAAICAINVQLQSKTLELKEQSLSRASTRFTRALSEWYLVTSYNEQSCAFTSAFACDLCRP